MFLLPFFLPSLHLLPLFSPTFLPFSSALLLFLLPTCSPAPFLFSCFPPVLLCSPPVLLLPSCSPVPLLLVLPSSSVSLLFSAPLLFLALLLFPSLVSCS